MKATLIIENYYYLIEISDEIAQNRKELNKLVEQFDEWLYDENNEHGLWEIVNGEKYGVVFNEHDFLQWINQRNSLNNNHYARIIKNCKRPNFLYPKIYL